MPDPEDRSWGLLDLFRQREPKRRDDPAAPASAADREAADMVDQAEAFQTLRVSDVMTPRADVVAVELSTTLAEVLALFVEAEHSRIPVFRETLDDPVGVVHVKDLLRLVEPAARGEPPAWDQPLLHRLRRDVLYIPASMRAADLLVKMRAQRLHMALVIDEFGGTDGLVTMEDLIEAVVGDIEDEHDVEEAPSIVEHGPELWEADARTDLEEIEALVGAGLTPEGLEEEIDTVGGLVSTIAGRVPQRGEVVAHPDGGYEFEVLDADPRRIKRVRIRKTAPAQADEIVASGSTAST